MIITNSRYALVGYFITSYPTRAHGIIVKYSPIFKTARVAKKISLHLGRKYARIFVLGHCIFKSNNLASDKQWAYRAGYSTELRLIHLTESWRRAVDSRMVVAAALVDFKKALDSVSHDILLKKPNCEFGVNGSRSRPNM